MEGHTQATSQGRNISQSVRRLGCSSSQKSLTKTQTRTGSAVPNMRHRRDSRPAVVQQQLQMQTKDRTSDSTGGSSTRTREPRSRPQHEVIERVENRSRLSATPQLEAQVIKLRHIGAKSDKQLELKRNSFVAINHYYDQNHRRSSKGSPEGEAVTRLRIINKRSLSREKCFQNNEEIQRLMRDMLASERGHALDSSGKKRRQASVAKYSGASSERKEPSATSRLSKSRAGSSKALLGEKKVGLRLGAENTQSQKRLPKKLVEAVLSRTQKGQISVSINQNVSNVCYGPIYVTSNGKPVRKEKPVPTPVVEESGEELVPLEEKLAKIADRPMEKAAEPKKTSDESQQQEQRGLSGSRISIRLLDSVGRSRDRIITHNFDCKILSRAIIVDVKKNGGIPPTSMEYYKFVRLIGKGSFGKVMLGMHKLTGKYVAIKAIDKSIMKNEFSRNKVLQEVYILKKIRHANVIRLLEVFEDPLQLLIVMEYAAGGDLLRLLKKKGQLEEDEARAIFRQIVYGLGHIHARSVLHRDIKLDNILLDSDGGVKICDFGVSRISARGTTIKERCGTPAYIAPEILANQGYEGYYVDHWSLGIVLYAMLCASVPFKADNMTELLDAIKATPITFPVPISADAKDLVLGLLQIDPYKRLSIPQILSHPWMRDEDGLKEDPGSFLRYKDCVHQQAKKGVANIDIVNPGNLFFTEDSDEGLAYTDYCCVSSDLYTEHIGISETESCVDEEALKKCESYGFPRETVLGCLQNGTLNHATAAYNLLVLP